MRIQMTHATDTENNMAPFNLPSKFVRTAASPEQYQHQQNNNNTFAHKVKCFGKLRKQFYLWHFMWQQNILSRDDEALATATIHPSSRSVSCRCDCSGCAAASRRERSLAEGKGKAERRNGGRRLSSFPCLHELYRRCDLRLPKSPNSHDLLLNCWSWQSIWARTREWLIVFFFFFFSIPLRSLPPNTDFVFAWSSTAFERVYANFGGINHLSKKFRCHFIGIAFCDRLRRVNRFYWFALSRNKMSRATHYAKRHRLTSVAGILCASGIPFEN